MTDQKGGGRKRVPIQSTAEAEAKLDAICAELMDETGPDGVITTSRAAEIMGWSVCDVRAAYRYHHSWSVADYAKLRGFTRQHIISLINAGDVRGAFKVPTQGDRFEYRIPKETP